MILTKFSFFQKPSAAISKELDRLQLVLSHARIFGRHYWLPVFLKPSTRATHHATKITLRQSIDRSEELQFLPHEAQAIHCNHLMKSFYSPFHFPLILWLYVWHVLDRILAEMVSISPNIYTAIAHHVASVDRKTVN